MAKNMAKSKSMYAVFIIKPDGTIEHTRQTKVPNLKQLNSAVGGYIETLSYFTSFTHNGVKYTRGTAYCNDEGKLIGLPLNGKATRAWITACPGGDPNRMLIVGNVIFYAKEPKGI